MTRPDSIRSIGLRAFLDKSKDKHKGKGYLDFVRYIEFAREYENSPSPLKMSRVFNVSRPTMEKWLVIYNEEQKAKI